MWRFYHEVTQVADAAAAQVPSDATVFIAMGIITAIIVLSPSFFEKKQK